MVHWANQSIFYHIYPIGFCDAPPHNDFTSPAVPRLEKLYGWLDHLEWLGANALYLGPVFESSQHGYDTVDYYHVDRRLGNNDTLKALSQALHGRGMRLILDGVFNHVGRDFWAFYDLRQHGEGSRYRDWFHNLRFDGSSPYGDPFTYEGWNGHHDLVKLNLHHPDVREHLFGAVETWIREFDIDGLRLDAADCVDIGFLRDLSAFCRRLKPDFWLMGEIIHGDYRQWANPQTLDSVTNYECYKGLYSSHSDQNYFEIAYALNRQSGSGGMYRDLALYTFADNHDVNRVASSLKQPAHLYPLYLLLFTMPGIPSIYYGSEWGIEGRRTDHNDTALRPALDLAQVSQHGPRRDLAQAIHRLAQIRRNSPVLQTGGYQQLLVQSQQLAFMRQGEAGAVVVVVNAAQHPVSLTLELPGMGNGRLTDRLGGGEWVVQNGQVTLDAVPPNWGHILLPG